MSEELRNAAANLSDEGIKQLNDLMESAAKGKSIKSDASLEPRGFGCDLAYSAAVYGCQSIKDPGAQQACMIVAQAAYQSCQQQGW